MESQKNSNKKLIIVGAGVSGLSAGVYAARSGFDVTILEQHNTFGGLSTSWSRKGYFFEGGMHWLTVQILLWNLTESGMKQEP